MLYFHISVTVIILYLGQNCLFSLCESTACIIVSVIECAFCTNMCWDAELTGDWYDYGFIYSKFLPNSNCRSELVRTFRGASWDHSGIFCINKLFNSIACLLHFINLQVVMLGSTCDFAAHFVQTCV